MKSGYIESTCMFKLQNDCHSWVIYNHIGSIIATGTRHNLFERWWAN
jgi:hypothetical protein